MLQRLGCGTGKRSVPAIDAPPEEHESSDSEAEENQRILIAIPKSSTQVNIVQIDLEELENTTIVSLSQALTALTGIPTAKQEIYCNNRQVKDITKRIESLAGFIFGKSILYCFSTASLLKTAAEKLEDHKNVHIRTISEDVAAVCPDEGVLEDRDWFEEMGILRAKKRTAKPSMKPDIERSEIELHSAFKGAMIDAAKGVIDGSLEKIDSAFICQGATVYGGCGMLIIDYNGAEIALYPPIHGDVAMKIANHECSGLDTLDGIHTNVLVPLHGRVDYAGRRFMMIAAPPISPIYSLVYGSSDSALRVLGDDGNSEVFTEVGKALNLAKHRVVERGSSREVPLATPVLLQWHLLPESELYTPMCGCMLHPPDIATKPTKPKTTLLSQRLRPEYVKKYGKGEAGTLQSSYSHYPAALAIKCDICDMIITSCTYHSSGDFDLCSDCLANNKSRVTVDVDKLRDVTVPESELTELWVHEDGHVLFHKPTVPYPLNPDAFQITLGFGEPSGITELQRAHSVLIDELIPMFAKDLESMTVIGGAEMVKEMHSRGINVRFLGHIMENVQAMYVKWMIETEAVARCCASLVKKYIIDGGDNLSTYLTQLTSALCKADDPLFDAVVSMTKSKYGIDIGPVDQEYNKVSISNIHVPTVLHRVCNRVGVTLRRPTDVFAPGYPLPWTGPDSLLTPPDIKSIDPVVKQAPLFSSMTDKVLSDADAAHHAAMQCSCDECKGGSRVCERWIDASQMYRKMISIVQYVYGIGHSFVAVAYSAFGNHLFERLSNRDRDSRWNQLAGSVMDSKLYNEAIDVWERVYEVSIDANGHVHPSVAEACRALACLHSASNDDTAGRWLTEASLITETLVGPSHPAAALLWWECGHYYAENEQHLEACACMRRSIAGSCRVAGCNSVDVTRSLSDLHEFMATAGLTDVYNGLGASNVCVMLCSDEGLPPPPHAPEVHVEFTEEEAPPVVEEEVKEEKEEKKKKKRKKRKKKSKK